MSHLFVDGGCHNEDKSIVQYALQPEFLVEVPDDFEAILQEDLSLAADGQAKIRKIFHHYFNQGYLAADFLVVSGPPRRTFYLFTKTPLKQILKSIGN